MEHLLVLNKKLKNIYIKIDEDCQVIVKSSNKKQALEFLEKKKAWCIQKVALCQEKLKLKPNFKQGSIIPYLGANYPLILHNTTRNSIDFKNQVFVIDHNKNIDFHKLLDTFYKKEAAIQIPKLVEYWSEKMQLFPTKISFGKAKKRLGSCNHKNELRFNTHLMKLHAKQIEYVVVHELAHIKHKNHSAKFWSEVKTFLPEYKKIDKEIGRDF